MSRRSVTRARAGGAVLSCTVVVLSYGGLALGAEPPASDAGPTAAAESTEPESPSATPMPEAPAESESTAPEESSPPAAAVANPDALEPEPPAGGAPFEAYVAPTEPPPSDAGPGSTPGDAMARAATPEELYPCPGYSSTPRTNPIDQVMRDRFAWSKYPARSVRQPGGRAGDINWRSNPTGDASWYMWLHSVRWLGATIESGRAGNAAHLQHSARIARDWFEDNPYSWSGNPGASESTSHRLDTLICLRHATTTYFDGVIPKHPDYAWINVALRKHARYLVGHYSGAWNHGTDESISLLGAGCVLGEPAYGDLAVERLETAVTTAIAPDGATNEQSTDYAIYNYSLWGHAEQAMERCGYDPTRVIGQRRARLATFLAHSTAPDRRIVQLGDSEKTVLPVFPGTEAEYAATQGASGPRPADRVRLYGHEGFVFGRTGWGEERRFVDEAQYSIRYGPGRKLHGHDDRPAVTYFARGRDILVDSGHQGYVNDGWRAYQRHTRAHSALYVPTATLDPSRWVKLTRSLVSESPAMEFYEFQDNAYRGVARTRGVLVLQDPDVMVVLDRVSGAAAQLYRQLWALPTDQRVVVHGRSTAVASRDGDPTSTVLFQTAYGGALPRGATQAVRGQTSPEIQGWRFPKLYDHDRAPTVQMMRSGRSATILTVIAPVAAGRGVQYTLRSAAGGWTNLDMKVGSTPVRVRISSGGYLGRG